MSTNIETGDTTRAFSAWERRTRIWAFVVSLLSLALWIPIGFITISAGRPFDVTAGLVVTATVAVYFWRTHRIRRRRAILQTAFPNEWETVLQRDVAFFRVLTAVQQQSFRRQLQVFLGEKQVTGIKLKLDDTTRVLAAASAIIPIFGFPDWEWNEINEILIYPTRFDENFTFGNSDGHKILGMVGTGSLNRLMILSKPDLISGFRNPGDKKNVGVHEFAHLVDKKDGVIDGVPRIGLDRQAVSPWLNLVQRKMAEIESGRSDINRYALTNEAEFFAVASEYFFERPGLMQRKHPELYLALEKVFNQNLRAQAVTLSRELLHGRPKFGRNSPCPCGSGQKFKKCCLD
jgi:hypothetical protein